MTLLIVDNAIPVCDLIDRYEYPSLRNLITKDSFKGLILGLPPRLFPDNFLRNSCSFFLSPKLLSSKLSNSYNLKKLNISGDNSYLINHTWPGNVRELRNLIERIAILANNNTDKISTIDKALPI